MAFLCHQTLSSSPDRNGNSYWASFSRRTCAKGAYKLAHKAVLNGTGPRGGRPAIVKVFRNMPGTEALCDLEITRSQIALESAHAFNESLGRRSRMVDFVIPTKALMDKVAMGLLSVSSRTLAKSEWVLIEEMVAKKLDVFISKDGECSDPSDLNLRPLDAFVHFSYHHSAGRQVICGLKGARTHAGFRLTTPIIHSSNLNFGMTDEGEEGIRAVFKLHRCTGLCRELSCPDVSTASPLEALGVDIRCPESVPFHQRGTYGTLPPVTSTPTALQASTTRPLTSDSQSSTPFGPRRLPSAPYDPEAFAGVESGSPMFYTAFLSSSPHQHNSTQNGQGMSSPLPCRRWQESHFSCSPTSLHHQLDSHFSPMLYKQEDFSPPYCACQVTSFGSFPPTQPYCDGGLHRAMTWDEHVIRDVKPRSLSACSSDEPSLDYLLWSSRMPSRKT